MRRGDWQLLDVTGWADNQTNRKLLAWAWTGDGRPNRHVVVVNLSAAPAQGRVQLGWTDLSSRRWQFTDLLDPVSFEREGEELADPGLFVDLEPWRFHLFALD